MRVVVVALGKIGLPFALHAALSGHGVTGVDVAPHVVETINAGDEPFPGEPGLQLALRGTLAEGTFHAELDTAEAVARGADLVVVVPPLVVDPDGEPRWGALDAAVTAVGEGLRRAAAAGLGAAPDGRGAPSVVVETTLPLRTTRDRVAPMLEAASGLRSGEGFHAAHSPERVSSGRVFRDLETYPKLVGGLDDLGERLTAERYREIVREVEVRELGSAEAAEMTKLAETTYRDLNIAFANELAVVADQQGVDVQAVIEAANSQPYSHIHRPGVAVGGHCIPVYPRFLLRGAPQARLPALAREVNEAMPAYAVSLLAGLHEALPRAHEAPLRDTTVLVLGAAYRGGVKETAFSGVFPLVEALLGAGARPVVSDPLFAADELRVLGLEPWDGEEADLAVVQADHPEYRELAPDDLPGVRAVVDGRGVLDVARFVAAGVPVRRIGRQGRPDPRPAA